MRAKDFRTAAWAKLKGKWGTGALCALIYSVISGACAAVSGSISVFVPALSILGTLLTIFVLGPFVYSWAVFSLKVQAKEEVKVETLFSGFQTYGRAVLSYFLVTLFTALWTILLIIPGIIKSYSYAMTYYIALDRPELAVNDARKRSIDLMRGNKWRLFCLDLSFIGWLLLGILTLGILYFWIIPYMQSARAEFYRNLIPQKTEEPSPQA